jgi:hypothetical protein
VSFCLFRKLARSFRARGTGLALRSSDSTLVLHHSHGSNGRTHRPRMTYRLFMQTLLTLLALAVIGYGMFVILLA